MNKHYDVAIIGAGISGIMTAYELAENSSDLSIALLEQGKSIYKRACPIIEGKVKECVNCPACSIMKGFGGAGNFSDGKYNFTTAFGGWFNEYLPDKEVMDLINEQVPMVYRRQCRHIYRVPPEICNDRRQGYIRLPFLSFRSGKV